MAHARAKPEQIAQFLRLHTEEGYTVEDAAQRVGYTRQWGQKILRTAREEATMPRRTTPAIPDALTRPLAKHELSPVARDCLEDFGKWRARYFGRISSPWQEHAAHTAAKLLRTPHKEYVVVNCPPGSGKSTLFTHDIPAWLLCRDRTLRQFIGSSTNHLATSYTRRLRNTFTRTVPLDAKVEEVRLGLAINALSTLPLEYGVFKPEASIGAPWTASQWTVAQFGETPIGEKEASCTAFGRDTGFLGWRVNVVVWDDLVRRQDFIGQNRAVKLEEDRAWWDDEAETRVEPGGLLILQGQRLGPEDLYKYAKDKLTYAEEIDLDDDRYEDAPQYKKYHQIIYRAHYEDKCEGAKGNPDHKRTGRPYDPRDPENSGCLLDPLRLEYRDLMSIKNRPGSNFYTVYQQEDIDPMDVLVPKVYIDGGWDVELKQDFPGCWDKDREPGTIPSFHSDPRVAMSIITADPSPTKYWAVQWWYYVEFNEDDRLMGRRYLLDQVFTPMGANSFLDFDVTTGTYEGLLVEWADRAERHNLPVQHLILEANAAQKFMSQYKFFKEWLRRNKIKLRSHHTHQNKLDPKWGVTTIPTHYAAGRVRLPGTRAGRQVAQPLYDQVTNYPEFSYDDAVMAHWFLEYQLQHLVRKKKKHLSVVTDMPSWLIKEPSYG